MAIAMDDEFQSIEHSMPIFRHASATKQALTHLTVCSSARLPTIEEKCSIGRSQAGHIMPCRTSVRPCQRRSKIPDDQTQEMHQLLLAEMFRYKACVNLLQYQHISITHFSKFIHRYNILAFALPAVFKFWSILNAFGHIYLFFFLPKRSEAALPKRHCCNVKPLGKIGNFLIS